MLANPAIQTILEQLRPGQRQMAQWQGGELAVSAVPGAGKSTGMAAAAAVAIVRHQLNGRKFLVVVTFTRSAALNLKGKIKAVLQQLEAPPLGFVVYTLHGLALQIANRHPHLSGLNLENKALISSNQNHRLIRACVDQWIVENGKLYHMLIEGRQFDGEEAERLRRQSVLRTEVLPSLAHTIIREAKSSGLLPHHLRRLTQNNTRVLSDLDWDYPVLEIAAGLYERYQSQLQERDLIDYDDMILAALQVLRNPQARQFWQQQVFGVFEDEAQDSSPLQTQLLEILAQDAAEPDRPPNLVRVGDPNQAINSTFTPADPTFFKEFCQRCQAQGRLVIMDQAGRSTQAIMDGANRMVTWANQQFMMPIMVPGPSSLSSPPLASPSLASPSSAPLSGDSGLESLPEVGDWHDSSSLPPELPFRHQSIHPVPQDDPQANANPTPMGQGLEIERPPDIEATLALLRQRITELALQDSQFQGAVLVRENRQGRWLAQGLEGLSTHLSIRIYEVGQEARHSHVPGEILKLLQFIHRPHSPDNLKEALQVLSDRQLIPSQDLNALAALPEQFLYPGPLQPPQAPSVYQARRFCTKLLQAKVELPLMDLIGFLGFSLQYDQTELATADKLAEQTLPRSLGPRSRGESGLAGMIDTLREMVKVEKFEPIEPTNLESRYTQSQQLTIITMHKAKGLDWDYVFVPFLQAQTIPGSLWVPPQGQFLGDFTLAEVTRAQIRHYLHRQYGEVRQEARRGWQLPLSEPRSEPRNAAPLDAIPDTLLDTAVAWQRANQLKQQEEYRLLYVAMTRAKRLLWLAAAHQAPFSWQKPENLSDKPPCAVIPMLKASLGNESWVTSNE